MDGLKAFTHICEIVPDWRERLKSLSFAVNERHLEFTRLSRTANGGTSLHRRRTGSTESLRPEDERSPADASSPNRSKVSTPPAARVDINPDAKRLFQEYRLQTKRKRISGSLASNGSATTIPRSRMSLIVYYDSAIQEGFESMVRSIAAARNTLRKGKTAASMRARMVSMAMEASPFDFNRTDFSMRNPKIPRLAGPAGAYQAEPFEQIDRELETAQTLCEIGAHQFLRDGTCQRELAGAQERVDGVLVIAQEQRQIYKEEARVEAKEKEEREAAAAAAECRATKPAPAIEAVAVDSSHLAVDPGMADMIAVDNDWEGNPPLAVDSSWGGNPPLVDSAVAVEPSVTMITPRAAESVDPRMIAVDPSEVVDNSIAVDPTVAVDLGVMADPAHAVPASSLTVDPQIAVDHGMPVQNGDLKVDMMHGLAVDPKHAGYEYNMGPIEVDDGNDAASFHIDLTAFRRARGG